MATYRAMSTLHTTSNIPDDFVVNTWHISTLDDTPNFTNLTAAWQTFMETNRGWFPATVATTGHSLKWYDLSDPEPRAPVADIEWHFAQACTGETLPAEVAVCISFQGLRVSGEEQRRRRGRIFLGPISDARNEDGRPQASLLDDLVTNFVDFIGDLNAESCLFGVYSRADSAFVEVANVWVDNAFDTQRRRGVAVTSRQSDDLQQILA